MNFPEMKKQPTKHGYQSRMSRRAWLELRRQGLGGSDAGVALGCHPFKSPMDLYIDKKKGKSKEVKGLAVTLGNDLEPFVIKKAQEIYPDRCREIQELQIMSHPDHPWMMATVDAGAFGDKGPGIIEAKTALSKFGALGWINGAIPPHYRAQVLHYLAVSGLSWGVIVALTEGPAWHHHVIEPDPEELQDLIEKESRLWRAIQEDDFAFLLDETDRCADALGLLYPSHVDEKEIDLRDNERAQKAIDQYFTSKGFEKAASEDKREAENILKSLIGDCERAYLGSCEITWKTTSRGARRFLVKETK